MYTRTFKQYGIAYGTQPVEITAKVDNVVVYQGPVTTLNQPYPQLPDLNYSVDNELFSWTKLVNFEGPSVIEITVGNGAELLVAQLVANYTMLPGPTPGTVISSGPDYTGIGPWQNYGDTYINGVLQDAKPIDHTDLPGAWWWRLPPGSTFVENITVVQGRLPPQ